MTRGLVLLATLVAGCAEPVIEMSLRMPGADSGASFDMSCVQMIEVIAYGNDYANQPTDFTRDCRELTSPAATFEDIRREMLGNFDLRIPPTGLGSIEVYGRVGTCDPPDPGDYPPDVLFYGGATYTGDEQITIPLQGMLSCKMSPITARPLDILKLAAAPADCPGAALADGESAYVDIGIIGETIDGPFWFGGDNTYGKLMGGTASVMARMETSKHACVAVSAYSGELDTSTCVITNPPLCGGPMEVATLDFQLAQGLLDPAKEASWSTAVIGAVWTATPTRGPVQGARVTVPSNLGEVQYVEPGAIVTRNLTATGPSGLFVLYTDSIVDVTVGGAGTTRSVRLGADPGLSAVSLVVLK